MDWPLNNLYELICHQTKTTHPLSGEKSKVVGFQTCRFEIR